MKKALLLTLGIVALAATFTLQSCDKLKSVVKTPDVTFDGASTDIVIPPTNDTTAQATIGQTALQYNIDSMIKAQSGGVVGYNSIKSIKIKSITLSLNDGNTANNFANFIYAGATFNSDANNGNYDPYTIAYIENNPDVYSTTLTPPITDASQDLKKYFNSKMTFYYLVVAKLRRPIKTTLHCHVAVSYTIGF